MLLFQVRHMLQFDFSQHKLVEDINIFHFGPFEVFFSKVLKQKPVYWVFVLDQQQAPAIDPGGGTADAGPGCTIHIHTCHCHKKRVFNGKVALVSSNKNS